MVQSLWGCDVDTNVAGRNGNTNTTLAFGRVADYTHIDTESSDEKNNTPPPDLYVFVGCVLVFAIDF